MTPEQTLERLIAIKRLSGDEGEAATFVVDLLASWGTMPVRAGNNVWAEVGSSGPRLMLNSHLDTVKPCEGWLTDPWTPTWEGDRLIGLGSNDASGSGVAMLFAFKQIAENLPEHGRLLLALTAEEETGGPGGIQSVLPILGDIDAAMVGEPTGLSVCVAQRGMLLMRLVAKGVSAHVAHGSLGENAIHKAARDVAKLEAMRFEPHPILGETRGQVVTISGGIARNQIPDACEFFVDFRTTPNLSHEAIESRLKAELESEIIVHSERYHPKDVDANSSIARAALSASPNPEFVSSNTVSDWAFLGDIPAVKVGPGDTRRSHTANEYLLRSELLDGIAFYRDAAQAFWRLSA